MQAREQGFDASAGPEIFAALCVEPSGLTKVSALGVEEQRVWVIIDITSPRVEWASLGDCNSVEATIVVDATDRAIVVPVGVLFRRGDAWNAFVVKPGKAEIRQIKVAHMSGGLASLTGGLSPSETVVVYPPSALADGSAIRLQ